MHLSLRDIVHSFLRKAKISLLCLVFVFSAFMISRQAFSANESLDMSLEQKAAIEKVVYEYLLSRPEVLQEAFGILQKRQISEWEKRKKVAAEEFASYVKTEKFSHVLGNPDGDVTLVEFFDYNCGYCKQAFQFLMEFIKQDSKVRIILKDYPMLGMESYEVAQISIALKKFLDQKGYVAYHSALMKTKGQVNKQKALSAAAKLGVDIKKLEQEMKSPGISEEIEKTAEVADKLGMRGTPVFFVEKEIISGIPQMEDLKGIVANIRKCQKTTCQVEKDDKKD